MFYINDDIYYTIRDCYTNRYAAICISETSVNYELLIDYNEVVNIEEIVNTDQYYTGAEIRIWFFYNGMGDKYECFHSYLDFYDQRHSISDSKNYYLYADIDEKSGNYTKCRVELKKY